MPVCPPTQNKLQHNVEKYEACNSELAEAKTYIQMLEEHIDKLQLQIWDSEERMQAQVCLSLLCVFLLSPSVFSLPVFALVGEWVVCVCVYACMCVRFYFFFLCVCARLLSCTPLF